MNVNQFVNALGGTNALAATLGLGPSAISNWKSSNHIPPQWHYRLDALAERRGVKVAPKFFDQFTNPPDDQAPAEPKVA